MKQEEVIYRITRAVYDRLGGGYDEKTIEQIVSDVYRAIEPALTANSVNEAGGKETRDDSRGVSNIIETGGESSSRLIISVFGVDHPGIVAGVAKVLAEADCSIIDINQTVVQSKFAMVIIVDMSKARESASELKERFRNAGELLGVRIYSQREDIFNAMHRV